MAGSFQQRRQYLDADRNLEAISANVAAIAGQENCDPSDDANAEGDSLARTGSQEFGR